MNITIVCDDSARASIESAIGESARIVAPAEFTAGGPSIVWLDGLGDAGIAALSVTLVGADPRPVAVRGARWDGFEHITLAQYCRGVISGFGLDGLHAAIAALHREPTR